MKGLTPRHVHEGKACRATFTNTFTGQNASILTSLITCRSDAGVEVRSPQSTGKVEIKTQPLVGFFVKTWKISTPKTLIFIQERRERLETLFLAQE